MSDEIEVPELRDLPPEVRALMHAVDRMRDDWAEADTERRSELWRQVYAASDEVWLWRRVHTAGDEGWFRARADEVVLTPTDADAQRLAEALWPTAQFEGWDGQRKAREALDRLAGTKGDRG